MKYSLNIKNKFTALGLGMLGLAVVIRCVYFAVHGGTVGHLTVHLLLPILAAVTFFVVVLRGLPAEYTSLGVLFGAVFACSGVCMDERAGRASCGPCGCGMCC